MPKIDFAQIAAKAAEIREAMGDDSDDQAFLDTLDGETDALDILDWIIRKVNERRAGVAGCAELIGMYQDKKAAHENAIVALRGLAGQVLQAAGEKKVARPTGTVSFMATQPKLIITEEAEIPSQLWKVTRAVDTGAVKAALVAGEKIPGAELSGAGQTVRIV